MFSGTIEKVFLPDGTCQDTDVAITFDDTGMVIDKNNNGYKKISHVGKVSKVEIVETTIGAVTNCFVPDAKNLSPMAFMKNRGQGANAIVRTTTGGICEVFINME